MSPNLNPLKLKSYLILGFFLLALSHGLFAQNFKKMFNYIEEGDIAKAANENYKFSSGSAVKNSEEDFLLGISNCLILANNNYDNYDPYKSLETFEMLSNIDADEAEVDKFLDKYNLSIVKVHDLIYQSIFSEAVKVNTEKSFQKALDACQDCRYKDEIVVLKETAAYNEAKKNNSIDGYKYFISAYPKSEHIAEIHAKLYESAFEIAKANMSVPSLNQYITEYSNTDNEFIPNAISLKDSLENEEEKLRMERILMKPNILKTTMMNSRYINHFFPYKNYNGNQFFYRTTRDEKGIEGRSDNIQMRIVNDDGIIIPLKHGVKEVNAMYAHDGSPVYSVGTSQKTEKFYFTPYYTLPNISSTNIQEIGSGRSSYDNKDYLITKSFITRINSSEAHTQFDYARLISYDEIFFESSDVNNVEFIYASRLSNNDILVILKAEIRFLSHQLNRMFGIDGVNNISRTYATNSYYKFVVISEDGTELKSNRNYLVPIKFIRPVNNGFVILSENLDNVISLDENDFGKKSWIYSASSGRNILVTEGVNFSNKNSSIKGIKIFKFNNSAILERELTVDNPPDAKILKPYPISVEDSENHLCLFYRSYEQSVINESVYVCKLFDFDLNLRSTYIAGKYFPDDWDLITSMNDIFYAIIDGDTKERIKIPFE